jgi:demethylmenaquinone methyltransferase/2-methoxy-6-polyprenyl-1,4-benzoquinol methylase
MDDWRSYDGVAAAYERANGSRLAAPARDLIEMVGELPVAARVLDVGTGTGVTASAASAAGAETVVGVDPSVPMLATGASSRNGFRPVAARAIDLPFRDASFDVVTASFVLNHFAKYDTALYDMVRVLRHGGRVGVATWGPGLDELQRVWRELVSTVVGGDMLRDVLAQAIPWEDRFAQRGQLEEALIDAGLQQVRTEPRRYRFVYSVEEFLDGREAAATGRFVRTMLGDAGWTSFRERARTMFTERFSDPLNDFRDVVLAVATKPAY